MTSSAVNKQKHMTQGDRITIETGLNEGKSLREIASLIGKDPTTVSKEIRKHRTQPPRNTFNEYGNQCAKVRDCRHTNLCNTASYACAGKLCRNCSRCNTHCPDFVEKDYHCKKLDHAPFVCNHCRSKSGCRKQKSYYRAVTAYREYREVLVEARKGINISEDERKKLDDIVSPLIRRGQSPYMILNNHPEIDLCEKTIYNYIELGALSVKNVDLSKKVVYKPRKSSDDEKTEKADKAIYEGRTYKDYQDYLKDYPDIRVVEMDTVLGCDGSHKVLLTLHFNPGEFMMAYLMESKEAKNVKAVFDSIEDSVGDIIFSHTFQLILTDRGGEFQRPDELECDSDGVIRTSIYYCDPMCPWQKPHCEKNHEYIRKIRPEGSTFDDLTQRDVDLMMSHINSSARESLNGRTPFTFAGLMLPKELLDCFGLTEIPPDEVNLTPKLLK